MTLPDLDDLLYWQRVYVPWDHQLECQHGELQDWVFPVAFWCHLASLQIKECCGDTTGSATSCGMIKVVVGERTHHGRGHLARQSMHVDERELRMHANKAMSSNWYAKTRVDQGAFQPWCHLPARVNIGEARISAGHSAMGLPGPATPAHAKGVGTSTAVAIFDLAVPGQKGLAPVCHTGRTVPDRAPPATPGTRY